MIQFTVDSSGITNLERTIAAAMGQLDWITAKAMTNSAKAAKAALASKILPKIQGGPTTWTRRGLIASYAKPDRLRSLVGWNYGDNSYEELGFNLKGTGTPAGRYMGLLAQGGDRRAKSAEVKLRNAGILGANQFITPAGGVKLNAYGNVPASTYNAMLSRLRAASGPGYDSNRSNSTRSRTKRRQLDYFPMYEHNGGALRFIAKRVGRGFVPAFFVVDQPNYEKKFDIITTALTAYNQTFPVQFRKGLDAELARRAK